MSENSMIILVTYVVGYFGWVLVVLLKRGVINGGWGEGRRAKS